ncbi:MAG: hypothetical protein IIY23_02955 [Erysipelotrichaceae bacterium]|nr:hypothetical protein [Erysipelotrichaceae bacterium]
MNEANGILNQMNAYMPYAYGVIGIALLCALFYLLSGLLSFGKQMKSSMQEINAVSEKGMRVSEGYKTVAQKTAKTAGNIGKILGGALILHLIFKDYRKDRKDENVPKASLARSASKVLKEAENVRGGASLARSAVKIARKARKAAN